MTLTFSPDQDNEDSDDDDVNTLKSVATVSDSGSQKHRRGASKIQKQKRVMCHYTELVFSAKSKVGTNAHEIDLN